MSSYDEVDYYDQTNSDRNERSDDIKKCSRSSRSNDYEHTASVNEEPEILLKNKICSTTEMIERVRAIANCEKPPLKNYFAII